MKKNSYSYDDLIGCGNGKLFGPGNAKLPLPPMLMFDRITEINDDNGTFKKGSLKAELDIKKDLWFFDCHFKEDPVMPGCLGLDAMWQLVGFYLGWLGNPGKGRALGVGTVKFTGEVIQSVKNVRYEINMKKNSYSYDDLLTCGNGKLFGPGNAKLPLPPMLMFDRITEINEDNGAFNKGSLKAELDIKDNLWFFDCHFKADPVMPGCLGLDAMWQLVGFYLGWLGNPGKGRALGVGAVKFTGEVLQHVKNVWYEIDMKKIMSPGGTTVGLANGIVLADDKKIYSAESLKVGLFK